ncbi:MAG: VWA domain-containing protein [Bacteroidia bacterium]
MYRNLYLVILLSCLIGWNNIQAKSDSYASLNTTVDYVNQHLETFWLSYKDLTELNRNLNSYFKSEAKVIPIWHSVFLAMPAIEDLSQIPPAFTTEHRLLTTIRVDHKKGMQALDQYFKAKAYLNDAEGKKVYSLLENMADVFARYSIVHRQFETAISQENARQSLMEPNDPFLFAVQELHTQISSSRTLLQALVNNDEGSVRKNLIELKAIVERSAKRKTALIPALSARPGSEHDPSKRFEAILTQSRALIQLTETYLDKASIDPFFRDQGKEYYYYNQYLVNKFSRNGESLIQQFNRFLSLHELPLLRAMGEPHTFRVVRTARSASGSKLDIPEEIAPVHLIFLVDVSGSMQQLDKFPLFQRSFLYLVSNLRPQDKISLVSYSGETKVHLEAVSPTEKAILSHAIQTLTAEGKTNIQQGLAKAYRLAQTNYITGGNNRIVLVSDGGFPLQSQMLQMAQSGAQEDIHLTALYMGKNEAEARARLLPLARKGGGNYTHVQAQNAQKALAREVLGE